MRAVLSWLAAPGRGVALALLALAVAGYMVDPLPLHHMRDRGFDAAQRLMPAPPPVDITVPIVTIDEDSLAKHGQWPWPRSLVAELVRHIAAGKPAALGVDILFPEPDRFSPPKLATLPGLPGPLASELSRLPSTDDRLGEAFAEAPTVLGDGPSTEPPREAAAPPPTTIVRQIGADPRPFVTSYESMIRSLPEIGRKARAEAALTSDADEDGVVRAVPLFTSLRGQLIPSLGLQTLRIAIDESSFTATANKFGIERVTLGPLSIPTDAHGRAYIHFGVPRARYVSAADVLAPGFDASQFEDKIVLLGVTGLGLVDQKLTPMGLTQGIEVHADLIESILGDTLLRRPMSVFWIELALVLLAGLFIGTLVDYRKPLFAAVTILGIAAFLVASEFVAFRFLGWLVDGIYPAAVALVISGGMLLDHLRVAQITNRQVMAELAHQRELAARTAGELAAARDLQLGLLPHRFPPFPDRPDIDLFARIEPARAVGGDFFDFTLIDDQHLFFIIADVSGKGVPAALFMEMTLQIVRAAVQQHQCNLEEVMIVANAKTAAASLDMGENGDGMFVTAFAGIVNTETGEVTYASAGHDSPYIVAGKDGIRQFVTDGGPPLGVLDEYVFPVDSDRLEPSEVMLLFTDGVTEAQDAAGQLYSPRRLSAALETVPRDHARAVVDGCFASVQNFVRDAEQADDITVLAIRLAPQETAEATVAA